MISLDSKSLVGLKTNSTDILYVYKGTEEIYPGKIINNSDFLKYFSINLKQKFLGDRGDPLALEDYNNAIIIKSDLFKTLFIESLLDDDLSYVQPPLIDEYLKHNLTNDFFNYTDVGEYDQEYKFFSDNIPTSFLMSDITNNTAVRDINVSMNGISLVNNFLGPDTARNYVAPPIFDEYLRHNFTSDFFNYIDKGEYDQEVSFTFTNMTTWFKEEIISDITAVRDINLVYSATSLVNNFLGPDTARNYVTPPLFDEYLRNDVFNITNVFKNEIILGVYDQNYEFNLSNINSMFIVNNDGDLTSVLDTPIVYTNILESFLGPDTARNYVDPAYDAYLYYSYITGSLTSEFKNPPDYGVKDFDLVYSISTINNNFKTI